MINLNFSILILTISNLLYNLIYLLGNDSVIGGIPTTTQVS